MPSCHCPCAHKWANVHCGSFSSSNHVACNYEEAFNRSEISTLPVTIQMRHHDAENLEVVLYAMQRASVVRALECLETELGEAMQRCKTEITKCPLKMRSVVKAKNVVSLTLVYKWQSDSISLESRHFDAFADSHLGGAEASSLQLAGILSCSLLLFPLFHSLR